MPIRTSKTAPDSEAVSSTELSQTTKDQADDGDDDDEFTDDSEEEEEERPVNCTRSEDNNIVWTGYGKKIPVLLFDAEAVVNKKIEHKIIGEKYHMAFKMVKTECKLVRSILSSHGFHEAHPNSSDYNLMWTGSHLKPYTLRGLQEFQKVNHFPRSYEITRKDRLYKNIQRMQQTKGLKHFDFVPESYIVPGEFQEFCGAYLKDKGPWIVKPIASSRGRGIILVNHPEQVPLDETMIVCKYLSNPLVIDGFKFDVRLYVAVTSFDPLIIYLYEEGLTRFATVKYDKSARSIRNHCMHLTNYSVNKKSNDYVQNDDPEVEDYGNKWSLGALLRYLRTQGKDTTALMMRIEDVIVKTLISAELPIATACKMFMPFRGNCFELFGFDILIDDNLRPWVLEVNLSPSLACDAPLDLKIKSNMVSDLFSLTGFMCHDPVTRKPPFGRRQADGRPSGRVQSAHHRPVSSLAFKSKQRPSSASLNRGGSATPTAGLSGEEIRAVRRAKEEYHRRGGWVRIFPSPDSWDLYASYFQSSSTNNLTLFQQLYPERAKTMSVRPTTAGYTTTARTKTLHRQSASNSQVNMAFQVDQAMQYALQRSLQYERKLSNFRDRRRSVPVRKSASAEAPCIRNNFKGCLVQGVVEEGAVLGSQTNGKAVSSSTVSTSKAKGDDTEPGRVSVEKDSGRNSTQQSQPHAQRPHSVKDSTKPHVAEETTSEQTLTPVYNVVKLLENGKTLSKVQARFAFATYLSRVQQRLMAETGTKEQEDADASNEQMDLVLRFLKRAASNLQQSFKVIVPSHKLPLNDRRRILAKQLGDFIYIYSKETDQLKQRNALEKKHFLRSTGDQQQTLSDEKFIHFVLAASENELEEVLTTYTKLNKSASIFLGSNAKSSGDCKTVSSGISESSLQRRKGASLSDTNLAHKPNTGSTQTVQKVCAVAASIYSTKLTIAPSQRPHSASKVKASVSALSPENGAAGRPQSATSAVNKTVTKTTAYRDHQDAAGSKGDSEEAVNDALHRLAVKQQQRQYTAGKTTHLLTAPLADCSQAPQYATLAGQMQTKVEPKTASDVIQSANDTFDSFVQEALQYDSQLAMLVKDTRTLPAETSAYTHTAQHQQLLRKQKMLEQSKALLEQSKAKHQAMIAQAHAAQRSKQQTVVAPKPPANPAYLRKPSSSHRKARASVLECDNYNKHFYNSLKYDSQTGQSHAVPSAGLNAGQF